MKTRPFFGKFIAELEELFAQHAHDPDICQLLQHELSFRSTKRAKKLRDRLLHEIQPKADRTPETPITHPQPPWGDKAPITSEDNKISPEKTSPNGIFVPFNFDETKPEQQTPQDDLSSEPESIIKAWIALEVLSPTTFNKPEDLTAGNRKLIAPMKGDRLPWTDGKSRHRQNSRLYYQIILGSLKMPPATEALLAVYGDSRVQRPEARGNSVLASVIVDDKGCLAGPDCISLSSFGWGLPLALKGDLERFYLWPEVEKQKIEGLMKIFDCESADIKNQDGANGKKSSPLCMNGIMKAFHWLIKNFELPPALVEPPFFAICTYQSIYSADVPDPILVNSFFLKDLSWVRYLYRTGRLPDNLKRYLGMLSPEKRLNLLENQSALRNILKPSNFPRASWPGKGRHPLVLLQQCAVNAAMNDLKDGGILAVNGPPGTGKTTLLRDIVAAVITERARVMATYNDPEDAFRFSGQRIGRRQAFLHLYRLDEKLCGYEILVASSNNKAVENISIELPGRNAIADDSLEQGYFSTISNALWPENKTWGVISAVLGNAGNRFRFCRSFWWDQEKGLHWYLKHVCGTPYFITDQKGQQIVPPIILNENPPSDHQAALQNWMKAKKYFLKINADVEKRLKDLQVIHDLYDDCLEIHKMVEKLRTESEELNIYLKSLEVEAFSAAEEAEAKLVCFEKTSRDLQSILKNRPGWLRSIFFRSGYLAWKMQFDEVEAKLNSRRGDYEQAQSRSNRIQQEKEALLRKTHENKVTLQSNTEKLEQRKNEYRKMGERYPQTWIDGAFYNRNHEERQKTAPWLDAETARLRGDLFEAAIYLHKAFIDGAAKPIRHNCSVFFEDFCMKSLGTPNRDELFPHLWSTFFLIVPVVSTTFASVGRMLSGLDKESLGWLLVDEAGQALPQASVGALARCKRAVVVGDPLQIEPIVTLPEVLTTKICEQFKIDANIFNASVASTQTLADRTTKYIGVFEANVGSREVGVPLLVHRRCSEPMFSISNAVAYENLMVQAKHPGPSGLIQALGPSHWIDVKGTVTTKWCREEGEEAIRLLRLAKKSGCQADIYLVTPFVDVQNSMRDLLRQSRILDGWVKDPYAWIRERIGTVHTVQGREAEGVIFILGAPNSNQNGARAWAGKSPNLLNVAVTRAKEVLYVIGNRDHWQRAGVFNTLSQKLK